MKKKIIGLFVVILFIILLAIFILKILNNKIMPVYFNYAEGEMKRLVTTVINKTIDEEIINELDMDSLFVVKNDVNSQMVIIDFDPVVLNKIMGIVSNNIYDNLKLISKYDSYILKKYNVDKSIFYIPSGILFNTVILSNLGPKIPVKMELVSSINPNVETKVTEYGINNSLIEVFIHVIASVKMVLPMASREMEITVVVPVAVKLIQGSVPEYYLGNLLEKKQ